MLTPPNPQISWTGCAFLSRLLEQPPSNFCHCPFKALLPAGVFPPSQREQS